MYVPNSSWIDSISYLRAGDEGSTFLAIFLETSPPSALLYAGVPSWIPGLLMAGIRNGDGERSIGKAYNRLVKGRYEYERVEGKEKVRELRRLMERTKKGR